MPTDDLKNHATSDTDFYALLGVTFENSQKDLDRAWRKTALKYHPDKVGHDPIAKERFHLAQIGYDLLSDPASKALYDNARTARLQRKRQNDLFQGRRRQMKDDLEARERGVKRPREEVEGDEEKLEREVRRLEEDGKRRRKAREEALARDMQRDSEQSNPVVDSPSAASQSGVSEIDRTIKVRFLVEGDGGSITPDQVKTVFSKFGKIESVIRLSPKMLRFEKKQKKQLAVVCMIQYASVVGAHTAVEDFSKQRGADWQIFDSVFWAANKEPDFINANQSTASTTDSAPSTPNPGNKSASRAAFFSQVNSSSTPAASPRTAGDGLNKKPSFGSFSPAPFSTPKSSPFGKVLGTNSPSLEEMTMIRLKNAEKKRLAEQIQRRDEEEDASAVAAMPA